MTKKKRILFYLFLITGVAFLLASLVPPSQRDGMLQCRSNVSVIWDNQVLFVSLFFNEEKGLGTVELSGYTVMQSGDKKIVNRTVTFKTVREGTKVALESLAVTKVANETISSETLAKFLPDFFISKGKVFRMTKAQKHQGYTVFYTFGIPMYFCYMSN